MHRLIRSTTPPACLGDFDYKKHTWDDVSSFQKKEIWGLLFNMQGNRCAYCERTIPLTGEKRHIEHFRRKGTPQFKHLTFIWSNLFGSCSDNNGCGRLKDKLDDYEDGSLIKADDEDPEYFFSFLSTGDIIINDNLNEREKVRARETLRVFNLNASRGGVKTLRKNMLDSYKHIADELFLLASIAESEAELDEINIMLEQRVEETKLMPFATALKHYFISNLNAL